VRKTCHHAVGVVLRASSFVKADNSSTLSHHPAASVVAKYCREEIEKCGGPFWRTVYLLLIAVQFSSEVSTLFMWQQCRTNGNFFSSCLTLLLSYVVHRLWSGEESCPFCTLTATIPNFCICFNFSTTDLTDWKWYKMYFSIWNYFVVHTKCNRPWWLITAKCAFDMSSLSWPMLSAIVHKCRQHWGAFSLCLNQNFTLYLNLSNLSKVEK